MWTPGLVVLLHVAAAVVPEVLGAETDYSRLRPAYKNSNSKWSKNLQEYVKLRHSGHSKFPHLDNVLDRINKYKTTTTTARPPWRRYYSKNKKEDYSENYEDLDYHDELDKEEDDAPDYSSWENEDETKNSDYEESDDDVDSLMQAEEATPVPSTSLLTQYKWNHYGTMARVEESRRNQLQKGSLGTDEVRETIEHIRRMNLQGRCNTPRPKVIDIQSEHPSPGKRYLPHCTVLHRCSDDTGCCIAPDTKCQPKKETLVHLYFYTNMMGHPRNKIERLSFHNHTECSCLKIGTAPEVIEIETPPENLRTTRSGSGVWTPTYGANSIGCNCPEIFLTKRRFEGNCVCDCSPSDFDCINMKRGKEHFSLKHRKCIIEEKCCVPLCEYGSYIRSMGRCPRKQDKLDAYARVTTVRY